MTSLPPGNQDYQRTLERKSQSRISWRTFAGQSRSWWGPDTSVESGFPTNRTSSICQSSMQDFPDQYLHKFKMRHTG